MVVQLLKKDFLVAKRNVIVVAILIIAINVWSAFLQGDMFLKALPFFYSVTFCSLLLLNTSSQNELRYSKALAYLCALPFPRSAFVKAKYAILLMVFLFCMIVNMIANAIFNNSDFLPLPLVLLALAIVVIIFGIYLPVEFKYGYIKTKFLFMVIVLLLAFTPQVLAAVLGRYAEKFEGFFASIMQIPENTQCIILAVISAAIFFISLMISIKIFAKKDL